MTLHEPLPSELTGRHGWLTRYRRFPVFSPRWAAGRLHSLGLVAVVGLGLMLLPLLFTPAQTLPTGPMLHMAVQVFLPLLAGPFLGCWVRRQGWAAAQEGAALVAVVASVLIVPVRSAPRIAVVLLDSPAIAMTLGMRVRSWVLSPTTRPWIGPIAERPWMSMKS